MVDSSSKISNLDKKTLTLSKDSISLDKTVFFIPETLQNQAHAFSAIKNVCVRFDEVLKLLEDGVVEKIIFHPLTPSKERHYIFSWARVFNPNIEENHSTHFPAQNSGSNQVA